MYFCLCCAPPTPTAGWATSEWVAGRAVEDSPFPTRIAPRRYVPPMSGQRGNHPLAVGGVSARRG